MNDSKDSWTKLIRAAKPALDREKSVPPSSPSIVQLKRAVKDIVVMLTWRKWALVAATVAAGVALAAYFLNDGRAPARPLIEPDPTLSEELS